MVEASFQPLPNLSPSLSTFGETTRAGKVPESSTSGITTERALAMNRNRNTGYKIRGLLASPASVNVSLYLENFQHLMMGGFKSVQLWYCQEETETSSHPLPSHPVLLGDNAKDLHSRGDVVLGGETMGNSDGSPPSSSSLLTSSSCVFVPDRKVRSIHSSLTYTTLT